MKTIELKSKIIRNNGLISEAIDDELVMADIDTGKYYGFNNIASNIWTKIEKKISVDDLCNQLCEEYSVEREQCRSDVKAFLTDLEARKLISVEE